MDNNHANVPFIVHEGIVTRLERSNRRMWILCIIVFAAFVISNCCWIWYESQWEDVVTTTESYESVSDSGGVAIANGSGEVVYGGEK